MNRHALVRVVLTVGVLAAASTIRADEPAKTDPKDVEISALREKVKAQSDEIQKLRAEVKQLKALRELKVLVTPPAQPQVVPGPHLPGGPGAQVPPSWIPRESNGIKYYLIPLSEDGGRVETTAVPTAPQNAAPADAQERYLPKP
jgi:hypothetical protein